MPGTDEHGDPRASLVYRLAAWIAFAIMRVQRWRVDVQGIEHLPRHGGAVIAANHTSFWDFFTSGWHPYRCWGRPVRILAKASLFRARVFGWFMRRAEHIPVERGAGRMALRHAVTGLERGELILVLPEQTISPSLELLPFKPGAVRMAAAAGVPVIPTISWGSHRFHTVGRKPRWSWRLPVTVRYGEPLYPRPDDDPVAVTEELRRRMLVLLDEVQRTYPDGLPAGAWWVPARLGGGAASAEEADEFLRRLAERWHRPSATVEGGASGSAASHPDGTTTPLTAPGPETEDAVAAEEPAGEEQAS
ncbi:MAG: lysophospholipid acyltransferase family protein [Nitriliruptoraceae bacterium]